MDEHSAAPAWAGAARLREDNMHDARNTTPTAAGTPAATMHAARRRTHTLPVLFAICLMAALALAAPAGAALSDVGPVVPDHGFPEWYQDGSGVRLGLCVENGDPYCTSTAPNPGPAIVSPNADQSNFPEETFYFRARARIDIRATPRIRARLILAQEAAFLNGPVADGDQVTFGRIRVTLEGMKPGAIYTATHPYGTEKLTADSRGRARTTDDVGCATTPCDWRAALKTRVGPFLRWDAKVAPQAPAGYLGDAVTDHQVTGSPRGTNLFRVTGPSAGGPGVNRIETKLFTVEGRLATTQGTASAPAPAGTAPAGGTAPAEGTTQGGTTPVAGTAPAPPADPVGPAAPAAPARPAAPAAPARPAAPAAPAAPSAPAAPAPLRLPLPLHLPPLGSGRRAAPGPGALPGRAPSRLRRPPRARVTDPSAAARQRVT
jgi:hypothetical protein